jgi:hypothetical protein
MAGMWKAKAVGTIEKNHERPDYFGVTAEIGARRRWNAGKKRYRVGRLLGYC